MEALKSIIVICFLIVGATALAEKVDIKDVNTEGDQTTTIQIKKGDHEKKAEALWEIVEGSGDIQGDPAVLRKEARASWKKACDDWKKEIKENNKENKIIAINCNSPTCKQETDGNVCESKGAYKVKTKLN